MKKITTIVYLLLIVISVKAQTNPSQLKGMELYKKLYKEGKISGDAYMTMLFTMATLSVAEKEAKFKENKEKQAQEKPAPEVSEQEIANAWKTILYSAVASDPEISSALGMVLQSTGFSNYPMQASTDLKNIGRAYSTNTSLTTQPGVLSDGLTYLALKSAGANQNDMLLYSPGSAYYSQVAGVSAAEAAAIIAGIQGISNFIQENAAINAINKEKKSYFESHLFRLSDYPAVRDKSVFPDFEINSTNFKQYFRPLKYERTGPISALKLGTLLYESTVLEEGVKISWREVQGSANSEILPQSFKYGSALPVFLPDVKFDFSKDFEFTMDLTAPGSTQGFKIEFVLGGSYILDFIPYINQGSSLSHIRIYNNITTYSPENNRFFDNQRFSNSEGTITKTISKDIKKLILKKQGSKLIAYWANEKGKKLEFDIDAFIDNTSFKVLLNSGMDKVDHIIIKEMTLRYL